MSKIFYSVEQAARKLELSVRQVESMISSEKLPVISVGNRRVIPANAVDSLNNKGAYSAKRPASSGKSRSSKRPQTSLDNQSKDYYTDVEVAQRLNKPYTEVYRMANLGQLPVTFVDDKRVFPRQAIDHLAAQKASSENAVSKPDQRDRVKASRSQHNRVRKSQEKVSSQSLKTAASKPTESQVSENDYYTPEQIAHALQRGAEDVDRMIRWGEIKTTTIEGQHWISKKEVERIISKHLKSHQDKIRKRLPIPQRLRIDHNENLSKPGMKATSPETTESEKRVVIEVPERVVKLQAELAKERQRRLAAEKLVNLSGSESLSRDEYDRQLADMRLQLSNMQRDHAAQVKIIEEDLEEERTKRIQSERRADTFEDELLTPKTSWQSDRELELEHELALEREGRKQDTLDSQYEIDQLNAELENTRRDGGQSLTLREELAEEKSKRLNSEERLTDLMLKLESNEAKKKDLETALSLLQRKVLQLEEETRVMSEVRRLLSAESQVQITATEDTDPPKPSHADDPSQQNLLLKTPFGQSAFRPPFPLTDREIELLRLVAREDEITAEQIRKRKGRRAVEDLNELLDRLEIEGMNPIKEINDRYSFHPDNLPSE